MMSRLVASDGLFRHWQETNSPAAERARGAALASRLETAKSRPIPDGSVWTFNVAPDSVYGIGNDYGFATFGLLQLADEFSNWRIQVETVDVF
jgi:hypothetical protein